MHPASFKARDYFLQWSARKYTVLLFLSLFFLFFSLLFLAYYHRIREIRFLSSEQTAFHAQIASQALREFHQHLFFQAQTLEHQPALRPLIDSPRFQDSEPLSRVPACPELDSSFSSSFDGFLLLNAQSLVQCTSASFPVASLPFLSSLSLTGPSIGSLFQNERGAYFPVYAPLQSSPGFIVLLVPVRALNRLKQAFFYPFTTLYFLDPSSQWDASFSSYIPFSDFNQFLSHQHHPLPSYSSFSFSYETFIRQSPSSFGWTVYASTSSAFIYAKLQRDVFFQTVILLCFGVLTLVFVWLLIRRLSGATSILVQAAENAQTLFSKTSFSPQTGVTDIDQSLLQLQRQHHVHLEAQDSLDLWRQVSDRTCTGMAVLTRDLSDPSSFLQIDLCNPSFERLSGLEHCQGHSLFQSVPSFSIFKNPDVQRQIFSTIASHQSLTLSLQGFDRSHHPCHVLLSLQPLTPRRESQLQYCLTLEDVTVLVQQEAQLKEQHTTDPLTQLPNRYFFMTLLDRSIQQVSPQHPFCALALLDIDQFQYFNDALGHPVGDAILKTVAERFSFHLQEGEFLARLSGDEFAIVFTRLGTTEDVIQRVHSFRDLFKDPLVIHNQGESHRLNLTVSSGISFYPQDGTQAFSLTQSAGVALFHAKKNRGHSSIQTHSSSMSQEFKQHLALEQALKNALAHQRIEVLFQPKISLATGQPCGVEALSRWHDSDLGWISPASFIPLAEESELIDALGLYVLQQSLKAARDLMIAGFMHMPVAINVSPRQIKPSFITVLKEALHTFQLPPHLLHIEITEASVMPDQEYVDQFLSDLNDLGILIALDDFGTGWSNMATLKQLPLSYLKMDRSFVRHLTSDPEATFSPQDQAIAQAIVDLGHALHLQIIAEGVETQDQASVLKQLGVHQIQGFLVHPALPLEDLIAWLKEQPVLSFP